MLATRALPSSLAGGVAMTTCVVRARCRSHSLRLAHASLRAGATVLALAALSPLAGTAAAQVISVKTVPVVESEQFGFFPSANLGMGGVSIALADSLLDPFVNPATAARLRGSLFFGSPTFFWTSRLSGGGST